MKAGQVSAVQQTLLKKMADGQQVWCFPEIVSCSLGFTYTSSQAVYRRTVRKLVDIGMLAVQGKKVVMTDKGRSYLQQPESWEAAL